MARPLLKSSAIYTLGTMLNRAAGFLLIPIYTRYLSVAEYGMMALLVMILQIASFICLFGLSTAAMRYYYEPGADEEYRRLVYGNATLILAVLAPATLLLLGPLVYVLSTAFLESVPFQPYILLALGAALFSPVIMLMTGLLRVQNRPVAFVTFNVGFFLFQAFTTFLAIVILHGGLVGQLGAQLLTYLSFAIIAVVILLRHSQLRFSGPHAMHLLAMGAPMIPLFIFNWMNNAVPRFLLEGYGSMQELGLFALALQFGGLIVMFATALNNAMMPHYFQVAQLPRGPFLLGEMVTKYMTVLGLVGLAVIVVAEPAIRWMADPAYHDAIRYVAPLALASFLLVCITPIQWHLTHHKRTALLSGLRGLTIVLTILLSAFLLGHEKLGTIGLIVAMLLANAIGLALGYALSQRLQPIALPRRRLAAIATIMIGGGTLMHFAGNYFGPILTFSLRAVMFLTAAATTFRLAGMGDLRRVLDFRKW